MPKIFHNGTENIVKSEKETESVRDSYVIVTVLTEHEDVSILLGLHLVMTVMD